MNLISYVQKRWSGRGGYREVVKVALPLILSTGAWSLQHIVDRMFLTWFSEDAIAAAMPAGIVNFAFFSIFIGTAGYTSTFVAQYYGARQYTKIGRIVWQGIYISLCAGVIGLLVIPAAPYFFNVFRHPAAVVENEIIYFQLLCLGAFPAAAAAALGGFFSGRGKTWTILWMNSAGTGVNVVLDYILIFGAGPIPPLGIAGAGIATVCAMCTPCLLYLLLFLRKASRVRFNTWSERRFHLPVMKELLRYGLPGGVQFFLDIGGFAIFLLIIGTLGTTELAASNIAFNINTLAFMPMIGIGIAISVLVGQYVGREDTEGAQKCVFSGFHLTFAYVLIWAAAYIAVPRLFLVPYKAGAGESFGEIQETVVILLRFIAVYSIFDTMNIIFASALKGAGDTFYIMKMILVLSCGVMILPAVIVLLVCNGTIYHAWSIVSLYIMSLGIGFFLRFHNGAWKEMKVIKKPPLTLPLSPPDTPGAEYDL